MHKFYVSFFCSLLFSVVGLAQYSHQHVLQGQTGGTLLSNLVSNYKPAGLVSYSLAKDNMFQHIYKENDTVTCVYTGLKRYLSPVGDPSTNMYDNASSVSIDTEHTYPQSKAINDAGRSDLHHMFPTRAMANNGRGSVPFGEIAASDVDKWYFEAQIFTSPPSSSVQPFYSKQHNNVMFEPRDDHKGNVARAMFYYYTMYKTEADAADPTYFDDQKATLCQWHLDDPVDSLEWVRTSRIALFQSNKANPFVLDCSLPFRCNYCANVCSVPNAVSTVEAMGLEFVETYPNPAKEQTTIQYQLNQSQTVIIELYNNWGQVVKSTTTTQDAGLHQQQLALSELPAGLYICKITLHNQKQTAFISKPITIQR